MPEEATIRNAKEDLRGGEVADQVRTGHFPDILNRGHS
jgi:hypothetical protein